MRDETIFLLAIGAAAILVFAIIALVSRRSTSIRDLLRTLTTSAGWSDLRNVFFATAGVKGTWRSFPAQLSYHGRQKGVPQRLILRIRANADSRVIVKRRFAGFFSNKPMTWFGPPLVEVHQPAAADLWVRGDDVALVERLFSESTLTAMIGQNLVSRFDEIRIDRRGMRILRALDDRLVRAKYGVPAFAIRFDVAKFEPIAREELELAEALVKKLSMMQ